MDKLVRLSPAAAAATAAAALLLSWPACCAPQTSARPDDAEAWRLLGETRLLSTDAAKSAAAYERAIALSPNDETIITVGGGCAQLACICTASVLLLYCFCTASVLPSLCCMAPFATHHQRVWHHRHLLASPVCTLDLTPDLLQQCLADIWHPSGCLPNVSRGWLMHTLPTVNRPRQSPFSQA